MEDGVTGFVVDSDEAELQAVRGVGDLDRRACRQVFETRFDASRMAADYLAIYRRLIQTESERKTVRRPAVRKTLQAVENILARKTRGQPVVSARPTLATIDPE